MQTSTIPGPCSQATHARLRWWQSSHSRARTQRKDWAARWVCRTDNPGAECAAGARDRSTGWMQGKHPSADGSFGEANAAKQSRIPREQLVEAAAVSHMVRQYLQKLEQQN